MNIRSISKEEFESFNVDKYSTFMAKEKKWFIDKKHQLIGILLLDNIDKDWSYVILGLEEDNAFRAIDVKVSVNTIDEIERSLFTSMNGIIKKGKSQEVLFGATEEEIIKDSEIIITDINDEIKRYLNKHPEKIYDLSPRKFEELIASIMVDLGFSVELTKATRDGGRDIIASIRNSITSFLTYIECKRYSPTNKIGVGIIREVSGVHYLNKPSKSIIVTTSFFTKDARKEAIILENQLDLKDYNDIKIWLSKYKK